MLDLFQTRRRCNKSSEDVLIIGAVNRAHYSMELIIVGKVVGANTNFIGLVGCHFSEVVGLRQSLFIASGKAQMD